MEKSQQPDRGPGFFRSAFGLGKRAVKWWLDGLAHMYPSTPVGEFAEGIRFEPAPDMRVFTESEKMEAQSGQAPVPPEVRPIPQQRVGES